MSVGIGFGKAEITPSLNEIKGLGMLGWGDPYHRIQEVTTPLYARAMVLETEVGSVRQNSIFLCLEICFLNEGLRAAIWNKLIEHHPELTEASHLSVFATHTHSAPGGFDHYPLYDVTNDGFCPPIFDAYLKGAVDAVNMALGRVVPGKLGYSEVVIPAAEPMVFNRNKNYSPVDTVDRTMRQFTAWNDTGAPLGIFNLFAVHATSIHRSLKGVHSDNKGLAAVALEGEMEKLHGTEFVALFAQGAAGDVTPNSKRYWFKQEVRGEFRNDYASCEVSAQLHVKYARSLIESSRQSAPIETVKMALTFTDLSQMVMPEGKRTGPAELGVKMIYGTEEGRGPITPIYWVLNWVIRLRVLAVRGRQPDPVQVNKLTCLETGKGRVFFGFNLNWAAPLAWVDPMTRSLRRLYQKGLISKVKSNRPMTPQILPAQIIELGDRILLGVPGEFTTESGIRLRRAVAEARGVSFDQVMILGYANGYSGYITTPQEYLKQGYEGACTHFGIHTLEAWIQVFRDLSGGAVSGRATAVSAPEVPDEAELSKFLNPRFEKSDGINRPKLTLHPPGTMPGHNTRSELIV